MTRKLLGFGLASLAAAGAGIYWILTCCLHNYSRPFTYKRGSIKIDYVVCLKCGKEFRYDMKTLTIGERIKVRETS